MKKLFNPRQTKREVQVFWRDLNQERTRASRISGRTLKNNEWHTHALEQPLAAENIAHELLMRV